MNRLDEQATPGRTADPQVERLLDEIAGLKSVILSLNAHIEKINDDNYNKNKRNAIIENLTKKNAALSSENESLRATINTLHAEIESLYEAQTDQSPDVDPQSLPALIPHSSLDSYFLSSIGDSIPSAESPLVPLSNLSLSPSSEGANPNGVIGDRRR